MVLAVLLLATSVIANPGGHGEIDASKFSVLDKPHVESAPLTSSPTPGGFLQTREVPDALIDPYSVLGVLSFGVYIFYILYHRYQMGMGGLKHHMGGGGGHPMKPPAAANLFNMGSEENLAYLLEMASKILSNAAKVGGNTLNGTTPYALETLDYYDETTDLQSS